jgi:hypothetical protein
MYGVFVAIGLFFDPKQRVETIPAKLEALGPKDIGLPVPC